MKWLEIPLQTMRQLFQERKRYDVLGEWGEVLSEVDEDTYISRDVQDTDILAYGVSKNNYEDPDGTYLLRRFRTHRLRSQIMRGAVQHGFQRKNFDPRSHMRDDQDEDTPQMHSSCYALLQQIVGKVTGFSRFTMLQPMNQHSHRNVLCIDPCRIAMMFGPGHCTRTFLSFLVDIDIQLPASFIHKLTTSRQQAPKSKNTSALNHLPSGHLWEDGEASWTRRSHHRKQPQPEEARRAKAGARPRRYPGSREATPPPHQQQQHEPWQCNQRAYDSRSAGSSSGYRYDRDYRNDDNRWHR